MIVVDGRRKLEGVAVAAGHDHGSAPPFLATRPLRQENRLPRTPPPSHSRSRRRRRTPATGRVARAVPCRNADRLDTRGMPDAGRSGHRAYPTLPARRAAARSRRFAARSWRSQRSRRPACRRRVRSSWADHGTPGGQTNRHPQRAVDGPAMAAFGERPRRA